MIIRKLRKDDYKAFTILWDNAKLPYKRQGRDRPDEIEHQLKQPNAIYLVAEIGGNLVGSILGTHDGRKGWINRLAVSPSYRRQGIASRLVAEVEKRLSKLGIEVIACLIENQNSVSIQMFKRLRYKKHSNMVYFSKRRGPEA